MAGGDELPTNGELLRRAGQGDEQAWATLVRRHSRAIWAVASGFSFDDATRQDVYQLTWLRLLDHIDSIREPERLVGWLATTARRECLAIVRAVARTAPDDQLDRLASGADEVDAGALRDERRRALATAFAELDPRCRQLLRLVLHEPAIPYADIAEILEMPVGSIGPTRARCLERLKKRPSLVRLQQSTVGPGGREGTPL